MELPKVIADFKDCLLKSEVKDNIAKIILFGSYAKEVASPDSDIDILIFTIHGIDIENTLPMPC